MVVEDSDPVGSSFEEQYSFIHFSFLQAFWLTFFILRKCHNYLQDTESLESSVTIL